MACNRKSGAIALFSLGLKIIEIQAAPECFKKLSHMVGEKFKYVNVDRNDLAQNIAGALHLLEMVKIVYRAKHSAWRPL